MIETLVTIESQPLFKSLLNLWKTLHHSPALQGYGIGLHPPVTPTHSRPCIGKRKKKHKCKYDPQTAWHNLYSFKECKGKEILFTFAGVLLKPIKDEKNYFQRHLHDDATGSGICPGCHRKVET